MTQRYGQFCPVALASEVLAQKWMLLVVRELAAGASRFNDIRRGVPRLSPTLLKQRLDTLQRAGVAEQLPEGGYALTEAGEALRPVLAAIGGWGQRWSRDIDPDDLDPGWLVWNIHRRLDVGTLPSGSLVIGFVFSDQPASQRCFWIRCTDGEAEVCLKPPPRPADVTLRTPLLVMAEIWRGLRDFQTERNGRRLVLEGPEHLCRAVPDWFLLSVYASIDRPRDRAAR